jgi:hypothetical protein
VFFFSEIHDSVKTQGHDTKDTPAAPRQSRRARRSADKEQRRRLKITTKLVQK